MTRLGRGTETPTSSSSQCSLSAAPVPWPGYSCVSFMGSLENRRYGWQVPVLWGSDIKWYHQHSHTVDQLSQGPWQAEIGVGERHWLARWHSASSSISAKIKQPQRHKSEMSLITPRFQWTYNVPECGWGGVQAQFWDLASHSLLIMCFVHLIKLAEPDGRKNGVLGISCIFSHITRYNRNQKAKFTIIKIVLA